MKKVLVTGGCGYIGSHTIVDLIENDFEVISVDNLINSHEIVLDQIHKITGHRVVNYKTDICDHQALNNIFQEHPDISGIIHFAALKAVGESVKQPLRYYYNNISGLLNILDCIEKYSVENLIFSSSCSVYGNATQLPVTEDTPLQDAESPYAYTKQIGEQIIQDLSRADTNFKAVILRYFNPGGAHESGLMGESPLQAAQNLVPAITETASGKREQMMVFGDDYPTRDGSCVRDYIHIMDLANAHTKALQFLIAGNNETNYEIFNLGIGEGVTVLEAIHAFERVTGRPLNYKIAPRRAGDVSAIYSNYTKAAEFLNWRPKRNIDDIMRTAWIWEQKRQGVTTG